jgi:hypothetical protein
LPLLRVLETLGSWSRPLVLSALLLLSGCYPEYNWREVPVADGLVVAAFPGKIHTQSRKVSLAGVELEFNVDSARHGDSIFALGYARLPEGLSAEERNDIRRAMTETLFRSLGAEADANAMMGRTFTLSSGQAGTALMVVGRVLEHRNLIIRMMASGPAKQLSEEVGRDFIGSLSLR